MSRETTVTLYCDGPHGTLVAADEVVTVGIDGKTARSVDLCADCIKEVIEPVRWLLKEHGVPVTDVRRKGGKTGRRVSAEKYITCPVCQQSCGGRGALALHLHHKHDHATLESVGL